MKKAFIGVAALLVALALAGCSQGVSQAEYDRVVAERDELAAKLSELTGEDIVLDDNELETVIPGEFNESVVLSQLEVTEYDYLGEYSDCAFLVIKNNSDYTLAISANVQFYNTAGDLIGVGNASQEAVGTGTETVLQILADEEFANIEYKLEASREEYYESVVEELSYETTPASDKEILAVTNNGSAPAEFVEGYVLFFNGDTVVGYDSNYFTDDDNEIKPGETIMEEMDCYEHYDSIKVYLTGRRSI